MVANRLPRVEEAAGEEKETVWEMRYVADWELAGKRIHVGVPTQRQLLDPR